MGEILLIALSLWVAHLVVQAVRGKTPYYSCDEIVEAFRRPKKLWVRRFLRRTDRVHL